MEQRSEEAPERVVGKLVRATAGRLTTQQDSTGCFLHFSRTLKSKTRWAVCGQGKHGPQILYTEIYGARLLKMIACT